jgi:hypothetical protein
MSVVPANAIVQNGMVTGLGGGSSLLGTLGSIAGVAGPIAMAGLQFYQSYKAEENQRLGKIYDQKFNSTLNQRVVGMENQATKQAYGMRVDQYNKQKELNQYAANRAMAAEERRLNDVFTQMAFTRQGLLEQLAQAEGYNLAAAGDGYGRSFARAGALGTLGAFGRNQATLAQSLISAQTQSLVNTNDTRMQQYGADLSAHSSVAIPPVGSVAANSAPMPMNNSSLMIGSGLLSAFQTGYSLTPPGQKFLGVPRYA